MATFYLAIQIICGVATFYPALQIACGIATVCVTIQIACGIATVLKYFVQLNAIDFKLLFSYKRVSNFLVLISIA